MRKIEVLLKEGPSSVGSRLPSKGEPPQTRHPSPDCRDHHVAYHSVWLMHGHQKPLLSSGRTLASGIGPAGPKEKMVFKVAQG